MYRVAKVVCLLLAIASMPLVLMMTMFSPMLLDAGSKNMTLLQKLTGGGFVLLMWALPVWIIYFAWRTIKTWSSESTGPALLAALPACLVIAFFVVVNFVRFGP